MKTSVHPSLLFSVAFIFLTGLALAQPTDNPYRVKYNPTEAHWTDSLPWQNIFNINDFTGTGMVEKYNAARDAAAAVGGGVVFFPAGTYTFEGNITLTSGVVIRGETPPVTDAKDSSFAPPTRFVFPEYIPSFTGNGTPNSTAFKNILAIPNTSNTGVVYVDINRAGISIIPATQAVSIPGKGNTQWSVEQNRNILIFGIRSNNVAEPYGTVPATSPANGQWGWQRFSNPFKANIKINAYANVCVGNNRINDFMVNKVHPLRNESYEQPGYLAQKKIAGKDTFVAIASGDRAMFSYTDHHGLSINRKGAVTNAQPQEEPDLFRKGVEILDNWIYHTVRNGISCSGLGLRVEGNKILDKSGKSVYLHPIGVSFQANNSATYENRGIDWSGWFVNIKNNDITVYTHRINDGPYSSVDGEGILLQECCGGTSMNGATITGNSLHGPTPYIGLWKVRSIANLNISDNDLGGNTIFATANTYDYGTSKYWYFTLDSVLIANNKNVSGITVDGNKGGSGGAIVNNMVSGGIEAPCHVTVTGNTNSTLRYTNVYPDSGLAKLTTAAGPCVELEHPGVKWVTPKNDTTIMHPGGVLPLELIAESSQGTIVAFEFWDDAKRIDSVPATLGQASTWWQVPVEHSVHILTVKGIDHKGIKVWSKPIHVSIKTDSIVTSLSQQKTEASAMVYPNPGNGIYNVASAGLITGVEVYDSRGILKMSADYSVAPAYQQEINLSNEASGLYFFHIRTGAGSAVKKVMNR